MKNVKCKLVLDMLNYALCILYFSEPHYTFQRTHYILQKAHYTLQKAVYTLHFEFFTLNYFPPPIT